MLYSQKPPMLSLFLFGHALKRVRKAHAKPVGIHSCKHLLSKSFLQAKLWQAGKPEAVCISVQIVHSSIPAANCGNAAVDDPPSGSRLFSTLSTELGMDGPGALNRECNNRRHNSPARSSPARLRCGVSGSRPPIPAKINRALPAAASSAVTVCANCGAPLSVH
ncbi:hypothetical protein J6590_005175 [Homalodisca vitripennis]|nr:hypothetical protein J6590_005175 [Homalodisca vitripennis]